MTYTAEEHFTHLVQQASHAWRRALDRRLRDLGLGRSGWVAIAAIARAEEPLSQIEISSQIGVEGATMVTTLDRLEKAGLIERVGHPSDRRVKLVSLTPAGQQLYGELKSVVDTARNELLDGFNEQEMRLAGQLLDRMRESADRIR